MDHKIYIISDICLGCGRATIEGEMICYRCQREAEKEFPEIEVMPKSKKRTHRLLRKRDKR